MPSQPDSPLHKPFVFHDPSGRRARRAGQAGGLLLSVLAAIVAGFLATLALAPRLPDVQLRDPRVLQGLHVENAKHLKGRPSWQHIVRPKAPGTNTALKPLTIGFYVSWDPNSRASLAQHVSSLDVVAPQWFALKDAAGDVDITDDPQAVALISAAAHPPAVLPVVHNARQDAFDTALGDALLHSPAAQDRLIATLVAQAAKRDYSGYVFDIENISPTSIAAYPAFIAKAGRPSSRSAAKSGSPPRSTTTTGR